MPPATQSREEERRLNSRTLTIASVASATAAAVTSQLWIAGTWIAAALTPVLVAVISEALHRPTERVARAWTAEREPRASTTRRAQTATRAKPAAVTGSSGPVRVYRQTSRGVSESERARRPTLSGRRIPWRAVLLTGAAAFAIAIATITVVDLASTGSVNTTPLGRSSGSRAQDTGQQQEPKQGTQEQQPTSTEQTPTTTQPDEQQTPPSETAPATPPTDTAPTDPLQNTTP